MAIGRSPIQPAWAFARRTLLLGTLAAAALASRVGVLTAQAELTGDKAKTADAVRADLSRLAKKAKALNAQLLTTEKDWGRLPDSSRNQVKAFPVTLKFEDETTIRRLLKIQPPPITAPLAAS